VISRTYDSDLIKRIFTDPLNYNFLIDDGSVTPENYEPSMDGIIYYLVLGDEQGIVLLYPTNSVSFDIHICMSPDCRGKEAVSLGKETIDWIFENTSCVKINTKVPFYNKKVFHYAISVGFEQEGIDSQSFLKDGNLYDQYVLGIRR